MTTVTRIEGNRQQLWQFNARRDALVLDVYVVLVRQSVRHRFRRQAAWERMLRSHNGTIPASRVPLPADVKREARETFCASLRVIGAKGDA